MDNILTTARFRELAEAGTVPELSRLRKAFTSTVKAEGDNVIRFVITTQDVDRAGDIVMADGWDFENYMKNPVVLWCHDYQSAPIGRTVKIETRGKKILADCEFAVNLDPFFKLVHDLYAGGFMSAVSVGFQPLKWNYVSEDGRRGIDYLEQELLEYSAVPVPCNANALIAARSAGLDTAPMRQWAEQVIDEAKGSAVKIGGIWMPRPAVENLAAAADPRQRIIMTFSAPEDAIVEVEESAAAPEPDAPETVTEEAPAPATKTACPAHHTDTSEKRWSASTQERRVLSDQKPGYYRKIYGWQDPENAEKSAWKFIHHEVAADGAPGPANLAACSAGIGVLNGGRGGADIPDDDRAGVWKHIAAHLKDAGREAPPLKEVEPDTAKAADTASDATPETDISLDDPGQPDAAKDASEPLTDDLPPATDDPSETVAARATERPAGWPRFRHHADNGAVVWAGVVAAMRGLLEGEVPCGHDFGVNAKCIDQSAAYEHLSSHYADDFDEEPPEFRFIETQVLRTMPDVFDLDPETGALGLMDPVERDSAYVVQWCRDIVDSAQRGPVARALKGNAHADTIRRALEVLEGIASGTGEQLTDAEVREAMAQAPRVIGDVIAQALQGRN